MCRGFGANVRGGGGTESVGREGGSVSGAAVPHQARSVNTWTTGLGGVLLNNLKGKGRQVRRGGGE